MALHVIPATTVASKHVLDKEYPGWVNDRHFVYIGRKREGMHYGNPFSHRPYSLAEVRVNSVKEAVQAFYDWLYHRDHQDVEPERRKWILDNIRFLQGKTLVCFGCEPCHGDVYVLYLDGSR
jgi:hypothetical protein